MQNFEGHNSIINTLSVNADNVLFSGADNGSMSFWDWKSGYRFQSLDTTAQPGSLDAESGIMSSTFDRSGLRLICGESDKTIKLSDFDNQIVVLNAWGQWCAPCRTEVDDLQEIQDDLQKGPGNGAEGSMGRELRPTPQRPLPS